MAKTVVGLFDSFDNAQRVVQELVDRGLSRDDISLVANDSKGQYQNFSRQVGGTTDTEASEGAGAGAVGGTVLGGALGLLVGLGALAIPGIGPVIAAGPLAAAVGTTAAAAGTAALGSGIGAATGALVGGLVGAGIPDEDAQLYSEGVRRGGTLVMVRATDDQASTAVDVMNRFGAVDIDDRASDYRREGWTGFESDMKPYSGEYTSDYYSRRGTNPATTDDASSNWQESSKAGTAGGTLAGAATGAAIGAAGGPVGAVIGGVAGAATGAGVGAAGDAAGEAAEDSATGEDDAMRGGPIDASVGVRGADLGTNANKGATTRMGARGADTSMGDINTTSGTTAGMTGGLTSGADMTTGTTSTSGMRQDFETTDATMRRDIDGEAVLPVIEEELAVGKRQVQRGGARIHTYVTETPVEEQVTLREETVHVERRPVNREVGETDLAAFQEGVIEITETDEEAVVNKEARIVEEVVVNKEVQERTETIRDTVRRTDVDVEQIEGSATTTGVTGQVMGFESFDNDFRSYYQSNLISSGYSYDQYSPVFRYGYQLGSDKRYSGDWTTVEPEARRYWEERNPGTWENFKDSVRYAWERARGRA